MRSSCLSFTVDHAQQTHWLTHIQSCKEAFYVSFSVHLNELALLISSHSILAVKSSSEAPMVSYLANRGTGRSSLHWSLIAHSMELLWRLSSVDAVEAQWCRVDGRSNCFLTTFLLYSISSFWVVADRWWPLFSLKFLNVHDVQHSYAGFGWRSTETLTLTQLFSVLQK